MDYLLLNDLAEKLKIAPLNILREEAEMLVLANLAESSLAGKIIFYGGTALRLAYNCPRYSEDLDFLMVGQVNEKELSAVLQKTVESESGLNLVEIKNKRNTLFALLKLKSPFLKHPLSIKLELAKRKNGIEKEFRPLSSPCSPLQPVLYTATLASLEKTKLLAIKEREAPRDWFDAYYISSLLRKPFHSPVKFKYDKTEFKRELKRFLPRDKWPLIDEAIKQA